MNSSHSSQGFTLIELLISIAIMIIIFSIGLYYFYNAKSGSNLSMETDSIISILEKAKSNAIAGKGGQNYGVNFGANNYTYFGGNSFILNNPGNEVYSVSDGLSLSNTMSGSGGSVIFSRLTGVPQTTGTITVTELSTSRTQNVIVGNLGEIKVIK